MWKIVSLFKKKRKHFYMKKAPKRTIITQATWREARETCCSIGTTLATIQTNGKRNCMARLTESDFLAVEYLIYFIKLFQRT